MTDSTKRAIRTGVQTLFGIVAAVAILVPIVGDQYPALAGVGAAALGVTVAISKAWNALEEAELIPSWLKDAPGKHEATTPAPTTTPAVPAQGTSPDTGESSAALVLLVLAVVCLAILALKAIGA